VSWSLVLYRVGYGRSKETYKSNSRLVISYPNDIKKKMAIQLKIVIPITYLHTAGVRTYIFEAALFLIAEVPGGSVPRAIAAKKSMITLIHIS
jgi:hypothetical protein